MRMMSPGITEMDAEERGKQGRRGKGGGGGLVGREEMKGRTKEKGKKGRTKEMEKGEVRVKYLSGKKAAQYRTKETSLSAPRTLS